MTTDTMRVYGGRNVRPSVDLQDLTDLFVGLQREIIAEGLTLDPLHLLASLEGEAKRWTEVAQAQRTRG